MDQDFAVLTPEKTIVSYRLAGLGVRVGAHAIDLVIIVGVMIGVFYLTMFVGISNPALLQALSGPLLVLLGAFPFLYFILFEGLWNGQTLGKKACAVRVRLVDGTPITFSAAVGRNLLRPADMLPGTYFLGVLAMFTNPRSQRIGDQVAGTLVCYEKRPAPTFASAPHAAGIHAMEASVGELRGMTPAEYDALKRLCDRFPFLSSRTQEKLLEEIWLPFALRRSIPTVSGVHPLYLAEAVVMKYGRKHGLL